MMITILLLLLLLFFEATNFYRSPPSLAQYTRETHVLMCFQALTMGTGSYPGVKRPGRGTDHPAHLSAEIMKG